MAQFSTAAHTLRLAVRSLGPLPEAPYITFKKEWYGALVFLFDTINIYATAVEGSAFFGFGSDVIYGGICPAIGFVAFMGSLFYAWMARYNIMTTSHDGVTCMPYGINGFAVFLMFELVVQPEIAGGATPMEAYKTAIAVNLLSGCVILVTAPFASLIIKHAPPVAMASALATVGLIAMMPGAIQFGAAEPLVFLPCLCLTLFLGLTGARSKVPMGALMLAFGTIIAWAQQGTGPLMSGEDGDQYRRFSTGKGVQAASEEVKARAILGYVELSGGMSRAVDKYLNVAVPIGLTIAIESMSCVDLANRLAGESYSAVLILLLDGLGTLLCSLFGGFFPVCTYPFYTALHYEFGAKHNYLWMANGFIFILSAFGLIDVLISIMPIYSYMPILWYVGFRVFLDSLETCEGAKHKIAALMLGISPGLMFLLVSSVPQPAPAIEAISSGYLLVGIFWAAFAMYITELQFLHGALTALFLGMLSFLGLIHVSTVSTSAGTASDTAWNVIGDVEVHNIAQLWVWCVGYGEVAVLCMVLYLLKHSPRAATLLGISFPTNTTASADKDKKGSVDAVIRHQSCSSEA